MKEKQKRTYLCNSDDKLFKMLLDYKERFLKTQTKKNQKKNHNVNVDCEMQNMTMDDDAQKVKTPSSQTKSCQLSQEKTNVL